MREPRSWTGGRIGSACVYALFWTLLLAAGAGADERLPIKTYTTADGLAHNTVNRIVKDSRGFLWFDLTFTAPARADSQKLGADLRRDVLLTFKEAVHNAARHSGCSAVQISLAAERRFLTLVVKDNGRGFDPKKESEGHGLLNMRKRAQRLNGDLAIRSEPGIGTTITLSVPLATSGPYAKW